MVKVFRFSDAYISFNLYMLTSSVLSTLVLGGATNPVAIFMRNFPLFSSVEKIPLDLKCLQVNSYLPDPSAFGKIPAQPLTKTE